MSDDLSKLRARLRLGEDSVVELKRKLPHKDSLADEVAAFANARGGMLIVGVDDRGQVVGMTRDELDKCEQIVSRVCNDSIKPAPEVFTYKLEVDGKCILKIEIPRSLFFHKSPGGYFARRGSSKRELSPAQLQQLMQLRSQAGAISFDKQFVRNTSINTLASKLYCRFIPDQIGGDIENMLSKRALLVATDAGWQASVAGVLMCCDAPTDYLPHAFIQAVYYRSKTRDAHYQLDAKDFTGSLDEQITDAFKFVEKHTQVAASKNIGRVDYYQYSLRAIFEALVNAVVHRDYAQHSSKIRLHMFSDRLELCSPGALANTLTVETLQWVQATRNELLARLLSELTVEDRIGRQVSRRYFLERRGEGVSIIVNESTALSGKPPHYAMRGGELQLTIYAADVVSLSASAREN